MQRPRRTSQPNPTKLVLSPAVTLPKLQRSTETGSKSAAPLAGSKSTCQAEGSNSTNDRGRIEPEAR